MGRYGVEELVQCWNAETYLPEAKEARTWGTTRSRSEALRHAELIWFKVDSAWDELVRQRIRGYRVTPPKEYSSESTIYSNDDLRDENGYSPVTGV